jgi:hypothetical protein
MRIDHPRNTRISAEVDDLGFRRYFIACGNALNLVVLDNHDSVRDDAMAIPESAELDGFGCRAPVRGNRQIYQECQKENAGSQHGPLLAPTKTC